ncbi:MAG: ABC transporter, permease protein 1 (cluster 1, maltose/g3p/polyamine/iron) [uncultured Corynebacteriales bacterium]|uniref:ABC transporter, permease protein 1 (Cluster 1, maltose/g3p/polyamine/iron) n=1 Tax=uncultured Mycobacteriales bacterium TaxID=581187 RepID=A0A6J4K1F7_9ACTN|nr:MAG: ABC transporter, permease protein 1 (cluster 1, maltose/g3p/polyamine/iron) [uncultured Corynebacteriales bacterium]
MSRRVPSAPRATRRAQARLGIALVAPLLVMVVTFFLVPLANAVYYVFVDFNGIDPTPAFVGLDNFVELAQDPGVRSAFRNNAVWIVIGTVGPLVLGLALALLIWGVRRGSLFYRVAFFMPYVLPQVAIGVIWGWIYDPTEGWLNRALELVGLGALTTGWLGDPDTALYAVLATAVWATSGFVFIILLSALRNVDTDLIDAARLDGANAGQRLRHVIMPQIMPVFLMVTTITLVGGFAVFDIVFVMTGGGPAGATEMLGTYAYSSAFELNRISYGTTLALVITVMAIPFAVGLNRLQRRLSLQGTGA